MDPKETKGHYMGTPFGPSSTCAAAGSDAATVEHDGHIVGSFRLTGLTGHHGSTEVEAWRQEDREERREKTYTTVHK